MTLLEIKLWSELKHKDSDTLMACDKDTEAVTAVGLVRATASGAVMVGDVALDEAQYEALIEALRFANYARKLWIRQQSGRADYVTFQENGKWFCTHDGVTGELRHYRPRSAWRQQHNRCYVCRQPSNDTWIPVHKPWNGSNEVCACLCESCLKKCEGVRQGIRLVGKAES